jgi:ATP-dependent protease ClpP protease subunit
MEDQLVKLVAQDNQPVTAQSDAASLRAADFSRSAVLLCGLIDWGTYDSFHLQLDAAPREGRVTVEVSTLGGDPDVARAIGGDIRRDRELNPGRRLVFLGNANVYSAGATLMSYFDRDDRYLTRGARLMIHERNLDQDIRLTGPLSSCLAPVRAKLNEIEQSIKMQNEGFERLVRGSRVSLETVIERAASNWYIEAQEALDLGLIAGVI